MLRLALLSACQSRREHRRQSARAAPPHARRTAASHLRELGVAEGDVGRPALQRRDDVAERAQAAIDCLRLAQLLAGRLAAPDALRPCTQGWGMYTTRTLSVQRRCAATCNRLFPEGFSS